MRRTRFPVYVIAIVIAFFVVFFGYKLFRDLTPPTVVLNPNVDVVSPNLEIQATLTDDASFLKKITIIAYKNGRELPILNKSFEPDTAEETVTFSLKETGVRDGAVDLEITVSDNSFAWFGRGNTNTIKKTLSIDSVPPNITQKTSQSIIRRGGTGCVLFSVNKETRKAGVEANGLYFPAYKQQNGDYLCFFAFPYYLEPKAFTPEIAVEDIAGNTQKTSVDVYRLQREFKKDTLPISESFLNSKSSEFSAMAPEAKTNIERFLVVNGPVRKASAEKLFQIAKETSPVMLWNGLFIKLPRAAARAGFADHRTYVWEGKEVDQQTHLGYDFASVAQAEVPASNDGKVVFTGYLGIYGNLVIIDHGVGIHSLYSHLSEISAQVGQMVKKGDVIGKTGKTGMAGGDHLHFGMLVGGLEVTPLEWLDPKWIKDNITQRLANAGFSKSE